MVILLLGKRTLKRVHREDDGEESSKKSCSHQAPQKSIGMEMSTEEAEKCIKYGLAFFDAISYHHEFIRFLALRTVVTFLVNCIERSSTSSNFGLTSYQIALRIIRDRLSFQQIVKSGLALMLQVIIVL